MLKPGENNLWTCSATPQCGPTFSQIQRTVFADFHIGEKKKKKKKKKKKVLWVDTPA